MEPIETLVDRYHKMTGQTPQELFAGGSQYGPAFILNELVPKAVKERKKIVWVTIDEEIGLVDYRFEDI